MMVELPTENIRIEFTQNIACGSTTTTKIADSIAKLVTEKYKTLCGHETGKVFAGFVLTKDNNLEHARVVSIGSGTKCINGGKISLLGHTLNDCHAEVIARRGFMRFLYTQLANIRNNICAEDSILEARDNSKGFRLKASVGVHLYISSAPCGDGRLFSISDGVDAVDVRRPNRLNRGQLRVKLESGMGGIPVNSGNVTKIQTWDALLGGQRLQCMSCSDKILRWNVLGVQGSLLSHFIEPIYLDTLVIGDYFHKDHLTRSSYMRIAKTFATAKELYWLNDPIIAHASSEIELSTSKQAPRTSCNFISNVGGGDDNEVEVVISGIGKTSAETPSRLCKRKLFDEFLSFYGNTSSITTQQQESPATYIAAKNEATEYAEVKTSFFKSLKSAGWGSWSRKPQEIDEFNA